MVVRHNLAAENALRYDGTNKSKLGKSLEKLSSGFKINRAGDNAAGLAVSEKMRAQLRGIEQAVNNAQDGISMVQTFEGALEESHNILRRIKTLAAQSANGTYDDQVDRAAIELEYEQLIQELDGISATDFNGEVAMGHKIKRYDTGSETAETIAARFAAIEAAVVPLLDIDVPTSTSDLPAKTDPNYEAAKLAFLSDAASAAEDALAILPGVKSDLQDVLSNLPFNDATTGTRKYLEHSMSFLGFIEERLESTVDGTFSDPVRIEKANNAVSAFVDYITGNPEYSAGETGIDTNLLTVLEDTKNFITAFELSLSDGEFTIDPADSRKLGVPKASIVSVVGSGRARTIVPLLDKTERAYDTLQQQMAKLSVIRENVKDETETAEVLDDAIFSLNRILHNVTEITDIIVNVIGDLGADQDPEGLSSNPILKSASKQINILLTDIDNITESVKTTFEKFLDIDPLTGTIGIDPFTGKPYTTANLLDGSFTDKLLDYEDFAFGAASSSRTGGVSLQVGARTKDLKQFDFDYSGVWHSSSTLQSKAIGHLEADINATAMGLGLVTFDVDLTTQTSANKAIDFVDFAINKISMIRGTFGAIQNRLEHKIDNLNTTDENLTAAESRIRDTDMSEEFADMTKREILSQASQAMLAQANGLPESVLQLIQG